MHDAGFGHGVAGILHDPEIGLGPFPSEVERDEDRGADVVSAVDDHARDRAKAVGVPDELSLGFEEAAVHEVMAFDPGEGFGERRAGALKWDGVMIAADRGTPVRAVHRGRVVYADWLAGLGLLLIIDHGGGFLTLYGHNEQLFRAVGDVVSPGDTVASVGDSGGRPSPGLYFEIRQAAKPIDPTPWFRTRQP